MTAVDFIIKNNSQYPSLPKNWQELYRVMDAYAKEKAKGIRHAAAEIVLTVGGERDIEEAHRDIINLQISDK